MAGPYANLCACGADLIGLPASDAAINFPVWAIVAASRPRRFATTTARTPPATAVNRNAVTTVAGTDDRADRGHQLDVAGAGRSKQVARNHQCEPDDEPGERGPQRHTADPGGGKGNARTRQRPR